MFDCGLVLGTPLFFVGYLKVMDVNERHLYQFALRKATDEELGKLGKLGRLEK